MRVFFFWKQQYTIYTRSGLPEAGDDNIHMEYKYTGIILHKRDVGETDRLYTIYTLEAGKILALAKGVRKPQAKLAGLLENFTLADITVMRTHGTGKITSSIVENSYHGIKQNLDLLLAVFQSVHMVNRMVDLQHCDQAVFELLNEYLESVDVLGRSDMADTALQEKIAVVNVGFSVKLLNALGYTLSVHTCCACGGVLSPADTFFSAQHGGILCGTCRMGAYNVLTINVNTIKMLRLFFQNKISSFAKLKIAPRETALANTAVQAFVQWVN